MVRRLVLLIPRIYESAQQWIFFGECEGFKGDVYWDDNN